MPLVPDLDAAIRERLGDEHLPPESEAFLGDFEAWLTYLGEKQPWMDEVTALENRVVYLRVARAIGEVLDERQALVMAP